MGGATTPDGETWTVQRGESFWVIAEAVVERRLGRVPSEAEVRSYWVALVDANRDRLPHPKDPDLLFTGQAVVLPP